MHSTVQSPREDGAPPTPPPGWWLVVAHHPRRALVGRVVPVDDELAVGRGSPALGEAALDDETLSRRHATFTARAGTLSVTDAGSRNGTWLNGVRLTAPATLVPGDIVEIGELLLLAVRPALAPRPVRDDELVAVSGGLAALVDDLRRAATQQTPILIAGEPGAGKSTLAAAVHRWSGRAPLVTVPCAALASELAAAELHGVASGAYPGAVARAGALASVPGGTVILDGLDEASVPLAVAVTAFLDDAMVRPIGGVAVPTDVRVIATVTATARLRPELASRLQRFAVRVPPLRERLEDVPVLLDAQLGERPASKRLALALLRHPWPGNASELAAVVERARIDAGDASPLPLTPAVAARLGVAEVPRAGLALAGDGSWLRVSGGEPISLRRRENLAQLLGALAAARRERPGQALSVEALFRAGWPGQRADPRSSANRVYVALTSLRNLGLRDVLRRSDDGYLLDPAADVAIIE